MPESKSGALPLGDAPMDAGPRRGADLTQSHAGFQRSGSSVAVSPCRLYKTASRESRRVAQPGRAPRSGRGGRRFESSLSDQYCWTADKSGLRQTKLDSIDEGRGGAKRRVAPSRGKDWYVGWIASWPPKGWLTGSNPVRCAVHRHALSGRVKSAAPIREKRCSVLR
jgi:hypothetical protein